MPLSFADQSLWDKELEFVQKEKEKFPELFQTPKFPPEKLLNRIGINVDISNLPKGCIKFSPLDFIVEEVLEDDQVVDIHGTHIQLKNDQTGEGTIYTDLISVGISTLDANQRIADSLSITSKNIGYAGIKDSVALTSQLISIRESNISDIQKLSIPNCLLKDIQVGKGAIVQGQLKGNRFTIFVRTEKPIDQQNFQEKINQISNTGVINFYGTQRFGDPRYLSHIFGKLFLSGQHEKLIYTQLCETSPFEIAYITNLRNQAAANWKNWHEIKRIYSVMPYTFRFENLVLDSLISSKYRDDYFGAIVDIWDQIKFWTKSYASYLANIKLSELASSDNISLTEIPLLLSTDPEYRNFYKEFIEKDNILDFRQSFHGFPYNYIGPRANIPTRIFPVIHGYKVIPEGVAISFSLPKAAYATTVLMTLFNILPFTNLESFSQSEIDIKSILGQGNLNEIKNYFQKALQTTPVLSENQAQ